MCFREREEEEALELARKTQQEELSRQRAADQEKQDAQKARDRMREQDRRRRMAVSIVANHCQYISARLIENAWGYGHQLFRVDPTWERLKQDKKHGG